MLARLRVEPLRGGHDPAGLIRLRRRALRVVAVVTPPAAAAVVVMALVTGHRGLAAWAAAGLFTSAVALALIAIGSDDIRILTLAHSAAIAIVAMVAPPESVPGVVPASALASVVVVALMGRHRGAWLIGLCVLGLHSAAMLTAPTVGGFSTGMAALIGGGVLVWALLAGVVGELLDGEGSYRHLFDRVPVGLYRTALSGEVLDANHALAELVGYSRDTVIGMNARDLLVDPRDLDRLRSELRGGTDPLTTDIRFKRSDGEVIWVRDRTRPVVDEHGRVVWFEGELQDVTEERRHLEELEALVRSKSELIGAVSHELRTPLTAVVGFLDVLVESLRSTEGEQVELLSMAVEQAKEVAGIVEDLLTAARIDNRELLIHAEAFDVAEAVEAAVRSLAGVDDMTVDVPASLVAQADAGRVRQILRNLIGNAARHGEPPVRVFGEQAGDGEIRLVVADHGSRIPDEVVVRLFDAFFTRAAGPNQPGSIGLGLSVSRRLARLMGGDLAHRRVGDETQFVLRLPAEATAPARVA